MRFLFCHLGPFLREGLLTRWWLEQWLPERSDPTPSPVGRP